MRGGETPRRRSGTIEEDTVWLGVASVEELDALSCPTAEDVRAEQTARDAIGTTLPSRSGSSGKPMARSPPGSRRSRRSRQAGPIATVAAVAEAREARDGLWRPIRDAFVEGRIEQQPRGSPERGRGLRRSGRGSRWSVGSTRERGGRVASKMELERGVAKARREATQTEREIAELKKRLTAREQAFAAAYPEVSKRFPALPALMEFSTRRKELLDRVAKARVEATEIGVRTNELAPVIERMERLEVKLGLDATDGFRRARGGAAGRDHGA